MSSKLWSFYMRGYQYVSNVSNMLQDYNLSTHLFTFLENLMTLQAACGNELQTIMIIYLYAHGNW